MAAAEKRFSEIAEQFSNFVYEQADGLKPAADKFKLQVHEVDGLTRRGTPSADAAGVFTPAVIQAVFAPDSLEKRRNTKAIEIGGLMDLDGWNEAYRQFFGTPEQPNRPVRATVQVAHLVLPTGMIEIMVVAARPHSSPAK